jgi:hypothetical protein
MRCINEWKDYKKKAICIHNKHRQICKDCKGSKICKHNRQKSQCRECDLPKYILQLQRNSLRRILNQSTIQKKKKTIEYLGCSLEEFIIFIQSKMTNDMTFENIHLDHIKPVSRFDLDNEDEFKMCCHYTNFQPLLAKDNLEKHNKWSEEDDRNWKENIIYKVF